MNNLTEKDFKILQFLDYHYPNFIGPTQIGIHFGKKYSSASSWATSSLKRLVQSGKVLRGENIKSGQYRSKAPTE